MEQTEQKKKRLARTKRVESTKLPPHIFTRRDGEIVKAVYEYRVLTSVQLAALFLPSDRNPSTLSSTFQNRLKLLFHDGYLDRREQPQLLSEGSKPLLYFLDTKGARLIEDLIGDKPNWRKADNDLSPQAKEHLIRTNDIRIAIAVSAKKHGYTVEDWIDDRALKSPQMKDTVTLKNDAGNTAKTAIVPDGFFKLVWPSSESETGVRVARCFIECDLGTMTAKASVWGRRDYRHKILAYTAYINSGMYEARYGGKTMRVLTVTTTEERLKTLKKVTEDAGGKSRFWFTTFERIRNADMLTDYLWSVAGKGEPQAFIEPQSPAVGS